MGNRTSTAAAAADHRQLRYLLGELSWSFYLESSQVAELRFRWACLELFIEVVKQCSDAAEVVKNYRSVTVKIEAQGDALAKLLSTAEKSTGILQFCYTWKMVDELVAQGLELSNLNPEIRGVLDSILGSLSPVKVNYPLDHLAHWVEFAESTGKIVRTLDPASFTPLVELTCFVHRLYREFQLAAMMPSSGDEKVAIEDFFAHVGAVNFQVAFLCCFSLVDVDSPVEDLANVVEQISFANPKFLDITLKFLRALNKIRDGPKSVSQADLVEFFLNSFIVKRDGSSETFFYKEWNPAFFRSNNPRDPLAELKQVIVEELRPMVMCLIHEPEDPINKEDKCDLAEIKQMISEAILALRFDYGDLAGVLTIGRKIWLRKVGLFLKKELLSTEKIFMLPAKDQIDYLVNFLNELEMHMHHSLENQMASLETQDDMHTKLVSDELKSLYQSLCDKKVHEYMVSVSVYRLLSMAALCRAKPALIKLLVLNEIAVAHCKTELDFLRAYIELLIPIVTTVGVENPADEEKTFAFIESVCMRTLHLCYLIHTEQIEKETIKKTANDLLDEVRMVAKQLVLHVPRTNFPNRSAGMGFLDRLLGNLLELCKRERDPFFRDHMEKFQKELESLRSCIGGASLEGYELLGWKDFGSRVAKLIYESEYVIDSIEVHIGAQWQHMLWMNNLEREIIFIELEAATRSVEKTCADGILQIPKKVRAGRPDTDKPVVRLRDEEEVIIDRLTRGFQRRDVVSIVGMPGLGKTTLAKKVYDDPKVLYHFHRRAWCFVSQSYEKRDLLLKLLGDIHGFTDEIREMDDADLELKLWRSLKGNRYLIVMDDVWDAEAWTELQRSLPDDENGSRVMITSRLCKLSMDAMPSSKPHQLRTLSEDESWKLLEMRVFRDDGCLEELIQTGKEICKQCKGLPLAVVAVAGMLEKTEKKQGSWQQILKELNALVIDDPVTQCKSILEMSYNHLPDHLKACFLYFGAFQQDTDVQVRKLIQMWIAEGFIQNSEQKDLEEKGEDLLMDLIDRSLVMVSKNKSRGGVKTCRMHVLLRDLCLSKSKEENFLQVITCGDEPYASFHNLYDGVDFDYDDPSNIVKYDGYRVCSYLKRKHFVDSRPSGHSARSLIFIASNDAYSRRPFNLSFICKNFKLLRVLDLECINLGIFFPIAIESLVLLRYLALGGDLDSIPESISKLWKLETFILKGLSGKVVLPDTFWCMTSLRHVHVKNQAAFNLLGEKFGISILLDNLVTFSCPSLSYGEDTEKILRKLPNLLKLGCIFLESRDSSGNCNPFPSFDFLMHLESLNMIYADRDRIPGEFNLPLTLRKLTLSRFRLSWNHMSTIGRLPNLEVLKLLSGSLEGLTWDMKEEEFLKLKFLKLDSLNIVQWNASSDHLPELEQLVLWNCRDLEDVPYDFCEIPTLQIIEVQRCSESLVESIGKIKEIVEDLQVLMSHQ